MVLVPRHSIGPFLLESVRHSFHTVPSNQTKPVTRFGATFVLPNLATPESKSHIVTNPLPMARAFSARDFVLGIAAGGAIVLGLLSVGAFFLFRSCSLYSLDHWKLNIRTPLPSMWMNLGFW